VNPNVNAAPAGQAFVTELHVYPVKGCRGIALDAARVLATGLENDRRWMLVDPHGRFVTQRETPRLAQIGTALDGGMLTLALPDGTRLPVPELHDGEAREVVVWRSHCAALDCGAGPAAALSAFLDRPVRLVQFDARGERRVDPAWTGEPGARVQFADGFPLLLIGEESLADLNARLPAPLPMNRFRPNVVVRGLPAYGEDAVREFVTGSLRLRPVKGCTRCRVTTTDQTSGEPTGAEPLATLRAYRWDATLRGVVFGQNVVVASAGPGVPWLRVGQALAVER
jgi:uncharacterized protein YcbX